MSDLFEVMQLIDKISVEAIREESASKWNLSDDRDILIYRLAFNDAVFDFADRLKKWFKENTKDEAISQERGK